MSRDASREAEKYRKRLREATERVRVLGEIVVEDRQTILAMWVSNRLADPTDFETFIGHENVVDVDGRIDWNEAELRLSALLKRKPHLGVSAPDVSDPA